MEPVYSKEEGDDDYEDESSHSSSSETLTCSSLEVHKTLLITLALVSLPH